MAPRALYALTFGKKPVAPINHFYMRPDAPKDMFTQFYFWCILDDENGPILVDQGCTNSCLEEMGIPVKLKDHPVELLSRIGVAPGDVRHVILTHVHWDHYAGDAFYPNATYYVHRKEVEYVIGPLMRFRTYSQHYNFKAVEKLLQLHFDNRVKQLEGERESVLEGVEALCTGGHTPGLVSVAVHAGDGTRVICGDVVPRWQNVTETVPCGIHHDVTEALKALEIVKNEAGCLENILPGHDPAITERFCEEAPGVYRIF